MKMSQGIVSDVAKIYLTIWIVHIVGTALQSGKPREEILITESEMENAMLVVNPQKLR